MMNNKRLFLILFLFIVNRSWSQQAIPVTDTQPVVVNGLNIGYNIKSTEVKAVSGKGDFSRYAMRFYVTNVDNFAKFIRYRPGYPNGDGVSDRLVQFNIRNATGYRLTSNVAYVAAAPYNIDVPDDRPGHDPHHDRRSKQIGFWIQAGETRSVDEIVITPLNTLPDVQVIFTANALQADGGYVVENRPPPPPRPDYGPSGPPPSSSALYYNGFLKFENTYSQTFINNQTGAAACTPIQPGWWSAQWQLISVRGSNFFQIQNKWTHVFLDVDRDYVVLSQSDQNRGCVWEFEPTNDPNVFRVKNMMTGGFLCLRNQQLAVSKDFNDAYSASWNLLPQ